MSIEKHIEMWEGSSGLDIWWNLKGWRGPLGFLPIKNLKRRRAYRDIHWNIILTQTYPETIAEYSLFTQPEFMGDVGAEYYSYLWEIRANSAAIDKGERIGFDSSLIAPFPLVIDIYRNPMFRSPGAAALKIRTASEKDRAVSAIR
jgi:hypothetical protein